VDLGYVGKVGSVVVVTGPEVTVGSAAVAYVTDSPDGPFVDGSACGGEGRAFTPGTWIAGACNQEGR
jgi:hypothetical protein